MADLIINPYSFDAYDVERDSQGRATVNAKIMKAGRLKYKTTDGKTWYGNISLDELKKAIPSASHKPVTIKHPPGLLSPKDFQKYNEGFSTDGYAIKEIDGEQWLTGPVILASEKAIQTAEDGKLGVSPGYKRKAVPTGVDGEFDFKDIDINHIAIGCDNPRAIGASISLDEAEDDSARIYSFAKQQTPKHEVIMAIKQKLSAVKVGAVSMDEAPIEYEEASENAIKVLTDRETVLVGALTTVQESMDNAEETHTTELGELSGANKVLTEQVKDLETKVENMISLDDIETKLQELSDVRSVADRHKVDTKFTNVFDGMKAVVEKVSPKDQSFDDSEIPGAYKVIAGNEKDAIERQKSKQALIDAKGTSLDSGNKVSLSEVDVDALIKNKKSKTKK